MSAETKIQLREYYRDKRQQMSAAYREKASRAAAALLIQQPWFKQSEHIACYLHAKDEFETFPIIEAIWQANKKCYLPVLSKEKTASLIFVLYKKEDPLTLNQYKILEPLHQEKIISGEALDLVILPLVAFDNKGHRLGMGGGYYDKTFSFLKTKMLKKPILLGLAYDLQEARDLPVANWDVNLQGVLTEKRMIIYPETIG